MKKVYIVGIEGAGTSALARLYKARGYEVVGSDEGDGFYRSTLEAENVTVFDTFDSARIADWDGIVVHSTAYDKDHREIVEAHKQGLTVLSYPEALGAITREYYSIAVCGTHGKTTTTGMLAHTFLGGGRDVSALIGAPVIGWEGGSRCGAGKEFVFEADEYQNKLQHYHPQAAILTSIDYDHPDFFKDFDAYKKVFIDFIERIPQTGFLVAAHDDWDVLKAVTDNVTCKVITYGEHVDADARLQERTYDADGTQEITFSYKDAEQKIKTQLPGKHNALNALAAWVMGDVIIGNASACTEGLSEYAGVKRRFEKRGMYKGAQMIDDYAHHPEEVRTALATVREVFADKRIIAAFHPHSHSRTYALLEEFARALDIADEVIILDIYAVDRENAADFPVTPEDLVDAINQGVTEKAQHIATYEDLAQHIKESATEGAVIITLGAGDIHKAHDRVLKG